MPFSEQILGIRWDTLEDAILEPSPRDVEFALDARKMTLKDLICLLSPAAEPYLEIMAQLSHRITVQRFGRIIQMYAPLYLSSECTNSCVYCGFNRYNDIERVTLSMDEVISEAQILHDQGFRHLLLVSGESPDKVSLEYLAEIANRLSFLFSSLSVEVYPMDAKSYATLVASGVDGLTIYQETYNPVRYKEMHPAGPKRDYTWRIDTPDRGGQAGFRRINIGALLGLSSWRVEAIYLALHAEYLSKVYWKSHVSVSFPRLRPAPGGYEPEFPVNDTHMVQLMCALRLWMPEAGLVMSTREPAELRDHMIPLGVTQMSAGSKTTPGGYTIHMDHEGQFEVSDQRSPEEVAHKIASSGYEAVWKDWDRAFLDRSVGGTRILTARNKCKGV
jgi:2-iminoacetate synthase